ncbi:MAG: HDOD domain-containing protein [Rhodocyclaceae bacterium]|nr:HDOD domain-containing protein [Rhodocyclaceae bacterium]
MPQTIGRFEIRRELGRGSQSVVYLAWDPQLQRDVAIKTMHFGKAEAEQNAALLAEARMVSKLRHPNVVPIFDAGEADGDPYLVFEYVEGRNLGDALKADGRLPPGRAADLMRQVADALAQAHALGIIHRDLKPSNILLDARGMPRVMDFGIAVRVTGDAAAQEKGLSGTPSYMAPEYVTQQTVSVRNDVFAAGLILLELLTGARVMQGSRIEQVLFKVACEPVVIPKDAGIDERLSDIILRCCAMDPEARYPSATQLKEVLEAYLDSGVTAEPAASEDQKKATLEFLLRRMRHKSDFPALSDSVSTINKLTGSEKEGINKLSNTILKDYALTNKILRLVNSAFYRQAGGGNISTVSRAVIVLGFDAVRNIAITVLLFEHLQDKGNARELKEAFLRSNLAGLLARDVGKKVMPREMEESFICSLFHGLGQLLAQYYFPEEVDAIRNLMQSKQLSKTVASARVLGLSFEDLGIGIAKNWGFPTAIVNSMHQLPSGPIRKPATHDEMLRLVAGFSNEVCDLISACTPEDRNKVLRGMTDRFSSSLQISDKQLQVVVEQSFGELKELASILRVNLKQSPFARQVQVFTGSSGEDKVAAAAAPGEDTDTSMDSTVLNSVPVYADEAEAETSTGGVPDDAQSVLSAGIQDISNSLVEDFALNDILRIILETMYRAMGFRRVLLCLKDVKTGMMAGRFGFGPDTADLAKIFRYPLAYEADVFHLATQKSVDIIITDIDDPKIAERVPKWYREKITAKTFVLFPLTLKGNPVALIYCDKDKAGSIVIPEKELTLLKTLRNQALLAIKQST